MTQIKKYISDVTGEVCNTAYLSNGLKIYQIPSRFSTSHALFGVDYGSLNTSYTKNGSVITVPDGTAHFLEHKLFDNPSGPVDDVFTSLGASCNAYTTFSCTAYTFSCTDNFDACLDTLLDFVTHPFFNAETVQKEQGIIGEEIKMYDDSPFWRCYFNMLYAMYGDCPISRDIAGTVESISHITPDILYALVSDFYTAGNMRLCIYGGGEFEKIVSAAEKLSLPEYTVKKSDIVYSPGVYKREIRSNMETSKPLMYIGIKDDCRILSHVERLRRNTVFQAVFNMLFSESSDLFNNLYSQGLITDRLQYSYEDESEFAFGTLFCETDHPDEVYGEFVSYMNKIINEGINEKEFEISKRIVYADFIRTFDSGDNLPSELFLQKENIFDKALMLSSVTAGQAHELIKEFFTESNYVCSVLGTNVQK